MDSRPIHEVAKRKVHGDIPGADSVTVLRDIIYATTDDEALVSDIYRPPSPNRTLPVVLFVTGYSDVGMRRAFGCNAKDMASYESWARFIAASGVAAVTYTTREPAAAVPQVIAWLHAHAQSFGLDMARIGIWSCSGNVPTALAVMMDQRPRIACAALSYGYTLDDERSTDVADAARRFGFANPGATREARELPRDLPMFLVRAGRDEMPGLNPSIDRFVGEALALNLPFTLVNHPSAPHAFDTIDDSPATRAIVTQVLLFLTRHLLE